MGQRHDAHSTRSVLLRLLIHGFVPQQIMLMQDILTVLFLFQYYGNSDTSMVSIIIVLKINLKLMQCLWGSTLFSIVVKYPTVFCFF